MDEEVSRIFLGCFLIFEGVSRVFQGSFKKLSMCFKKVSCCMALIAASRAEGGLVIDMHRYDLAKTLIIYI